MSAHYGNLSITCSESNKYFNVVLILKMGFANTVVPVPSEFHWDVLFHNLLNMHFVCHFGPTQHESFFTSQANTRPRDSQYSFHSQVAQQTMFGDRQVQGHSNVQVVLVILISNPKVY